MNKRVKKVRYDRKKDGKLIFEKFRKSFLNKKFPDDENAAHLFRKDLDRLFANYSDLFFWMYSHISEIFLHRNIYRNIVLKPQSFSTFEKLKEECRNGALYYLPNHQSNIDSLVIPWIVNLMELAQPLFCAGDNLAMGRSKFLMPRVNAYLIDRAMMDDRVECLDPVRNTRKYRLGYAKL
ncbi:MAG: 1-acyl-sn-glycerol-3-phosphate acyltransferase, partial [Fibrobacterota bacterium]